MYKLLLQGQFDVEGDGSAGVDVKDVEHRGSRLSLQRQNVFRPRQQQEAHGLDGSSSQLDRGRTPRSWSFARTAPPRLCRIDQRDSRRRSRDEALLRESRTTSHNIIQISRELSQNCLVAVRDLERLWQNPKRFSKPRTRLPSLWGRRFLCFLCSATAEKLMV